MSRPPLPKEHGAWGMLLLPLGAGLIVGRGGFQVSLLVTVMVLAGYLARVPLESLLRRSRAAEMRPWLIAEAGMVGLCALLLLASGRVAWLVPGILAGATFAATLWYGVRRRSRELLNEIIAAVALPLTAPLAYAAASGRLDATAWLLWFVFALYHLQALAYVRSWILGRRANKSDSYLGARNRTVEAAYFTTGVSFALTLFLSLTQAWPPLLPLAFVPGWGRALAGLPQVGQVELPVKRLGWLEMLQAVIFTALVCLLVRTG